MRLMNRNRPKRSKIAREETKWGLIFISPWIIGFVAFYCLPMFASFGFSLHKFNLIDLDQVATVMLTEKQKADLAASFQEAAVDCLVGKATLALKKTGLNTLCVGGGVAANGRLRERLEEMAEQEGFRLCIAPLSLCTDNAVMGAVAVERLQAGLTEPLDLDAGPGVIRKPQA